jgi:regulator of replication initiation timing
MNGDAVVSKIKQEIYDLIYENDELVKSGQTSMGEDGHLEAENTLLRKILKRIIELENK